MAVQSSFYSTGFNVRDFYSTKHIPTKQHMAVWLKRISDNSWIQLSYSKFELLNNRAVLNEVPDSNIYAQVEIRVADEPDELNNDPSDIAIVAEISQEIQSVASVKDEVQAIGTEPLKTAVLNAEDNANTATTQANIAITKASEALTSANNASVSETNASTSEANALISENNALASENKAYKWAEEAHGVEVETGRYSAKHYAIEADDRLESFNEKYVSSPTAPSNPVEGMLWYDETNKKTMVYNGSTWQNAGSSVNGTSRRQSFTATAGQTVFVIAGGYDAGYADVYLNGRKLLNGTDVDVSSGTDIVLASPATAGDTIDVVAYGTFVLADHYVKAETDALLADKADKNGDNAERFKVADAVDDDEAVSKGQLLNEIKAVDGAGSGLDADLVRGAEPVKLSTAGTEITKIDGSAIKNQCTAWVNFNGTDGTIRDSYNVSSVVRNSAGNYTINFAADMNNANYSHIVYTGDALSGSSATPFIARTVSYFSFSTTVDNTTRDETDICVIVFGGK